MTNDTELTTYDDVNNAWGGLHLPPVTAARSAVVCKKLVSHFGGRKMRPWFLRQVNRSWAAPKGTNTNSPRAKGLPVMVHDTSHYVFSRLHPTFKTHSAAHATLEKAMIDYVIEKGLHVEPVPAAKPIADLRAIKLATIDASIKRWTTKSRRAATALRKLQAKRKRLLRAI